MRDLAGSGIRSACDSNQPIAASSWFPHRSRRNGPGRTTNKVGTSSRNSQTRANHTVRFGTPSGISESPGTFQR